MNSDRTEADDAEYLNESRIDPDDDPEQAENFNESNADPNDNFEHDPEVDEYSDDFEESSPQKQRYYSEFGFW